MALFDGQLKANEIFGAMYNTIISQEVFALPIKGTFGSLAEEARVDGGLYGDTKLYYSTDALESKNWLNDKEASNLLQIHRPKTPAIQAITIDVFRQISLTVDDYLSKRAWSDEYAFSQFNGVMLSWLRNTKKLYDSTTYNTFIGTAKSNLESCNVKVDLTGFENESAIDKARLEGMTIANSLADLFIDLQRPSRDYNEYQFMRSYDEGEFNVIWNSKFVNKIRKVDLPTIFNENGLVDKLAQKVLPAQYFGTVNSEGGTAPATNKNVRSLVEKDFSGKHLYPGDLLPDNATYEANETYTVDDKVICKIVQKTAVPFMSAFEAQTNFFNPKSLTENHYLTWGHNHLEYLKEFPYITMSIK